MAQDVFAAVASTLRRPGVEPELMVSDEEWARVARSATLRARGRIFCAVGAGVGTLSPRADVLEAGRAAARAGREVERMIVLADSARAHTPDVRELVELDADAGICVRFVDAAGALLSSVLTHGPDFGVWDEALMLARAAGGWRISSRRADVDRALDAASTLRSLAEAPRDPGELVLAEPLVTSAPLARRLAPALCKPVGPGAADCSPYHGLVQYMRLLGIVASPQRQGRFYREALVEVARAGGRRILISGAADYSMLAHVLASYAEAGVPADVTVIDRCPTPLAMCVWYARRQATPVRAVVADAAEFDDPSRYDVVCSDSLLTLLPPALRRGVVERWRALLRPGGRIVTSLRIADASRPAADPPRVRTAFAARVRGEAASRSGLLELGPDVLATEALRYATSVEAHPITSIAELEALFAGAGLGFRSFHAVEMAGRVEPEWAGPGAWLTGTYARISAVPV